MLRQCVLHSCALLGEVFISGAPEILCSGHRHTQLFEGSLRALLHVGPEPIQAASVEALGGAAQLLEQVLPGLQPPDLQLPLHDGRAPGPVAGQELPGEFVDDGFHAVLSLADDLLEDVLCLEGLPPWGIVLQRQQRAPHLCKERSGGLAFYSHQPGKFLLPLLCRLVQTVQDVLLTPRLLCKHALPRGAYALHLIQQLRVQVARHVEEACPLRCPVCPSPLPAQRLGGGPRGGQHVGRGPRPESFDVGHDGVQASLQLEQCPTASRRSASLRG
mmetsp:Transcript_23050/g.71819  ORF Transcript_23050/g.71819 Transcript_23050/m.71819 type:complete len:274 (-) Transcript_23050:516-1337(-)